MKKQTAAMAVSCLVLMMAGSAAAETKYPAYSHETDDPFYAPACQYILEESGTHFDPEDITIPFVDILRVDDSNPEDILVWGNYSISLYALRGTTLMARSGGEEPGLLHMKKEGEGYTVVSMDRVEDGSDYDKSVQEIFGVDDALLQAFTDSFQNEELVDETLRWYREDSGLDIAAYEDFGWDPHYLDSETEHDLEHPDLGGTWSADGAEMEIQNPSEGTVYDVAVTVPQENGSTLQLTLFGQYEYSTNSLYYWDGWVTKQAGETSEELENTVDGSFELKEDNSIVWHRADDDTELTFKRN